MKTANSSMLRIRSLWAITRCRIATANTATPAPQVTAKAITPATVDNQKDGEVANSQETAQNAADNQKDGEVADSQEKVQAPADNQKDGEVTDSQETATK